MEQPKITKEFLEDLYLKKKLSTLKVGKVLKVSDHTARRWLRKFEIPIRTLSETSTKYPKMPFSGDLKEKSYMLGLRTGDLYVIPHHKLIKVETTSSQTTFLKMFEKVFSKYGMVKVYERAGKITEKSFRVYCYLEPSFGFLVKKIDEIPEWVMGTDEYFFAFLAGYIDAEGSWIIARHKIKKWEIKDRIFSLGSCDETILRQIHQKLLELGFKSHLYLAKKKGTRTQLGEYHFDFYRISLYGKDVEKLAGIILPFSQHEDKQKKISEIIEFEKIKIEKLGTVEIPCIYCGRKRVSKRGGYFYKDKRVQRYKCPICKEVFSEQTIKKLESAPKISCHYCGGKVRKYGFYSYKGEKHQCYECPACIKVFSELTLEKIPKRDAKKLENQVHRGI